MVKSIISLAALAIAAVTSAATTGAATTLNHISFTQPVGDGISYPAGTNQTFSWTMACTPPSTLVSATPSETEVDFMDSNNIDNAFYVKKVGTIDCTKGVGNLVWTVPADTKPGVYALQLLLTPNNAYSGRFNVTSSTATASTGSSTSDSGATTGTHAASAVSSAGSVGPVAKIVGAAIVGAAALAL